MAPEFIAVIGGLAAWAGLVVGALVGCYATKMMRKRERTRENYRAAVAEAMSATLATPTRIARGLTRTELDGAAPVGVIGDDDSLLSCPTTPTKSEHGHSRNHEQKDNFIHGNMPHSCDPETFHTADDSTFDDFRRERERTKARQWEKGDDDSLLSCPTTPTKSERSHSQNDEQKDNYSHSSNPHSCDPETFHTADDSTFDDFRRERERRQARKREKERGCAEDCRRSGSFPTGKGGSVTSSSTSSAPRTCPVCLEELMVGQRQRTIRACGHTFHSRCLRVWLRRDDTCPLCRVRLASSPPVQDGLEVIFRHQLALRRANTATAPTSSGTAAPRGSHIAHAPRGGEMSSTRPVSAPITVPSFASVRRSSPVGDGMASPRGSYVAQPVGAELPITAPPELSLGAGQISEEAEGRRGPVDTLAEFMQGSVNVFDSSSPVSAMSSHHSQTRGVMHDGDDLFLDVSAPPRRQGTFSGMFGAFRRMTSGRTARQSPEAGAREREVDV